MHIPRSSFRRGSWGPSSVNVQLPRGNQYSDFHQSHRLVCLFLNFVCNHAVCVIPVCLDSFTQHSAMLLPVLVIHSFCSQCSILLCEHTAIYLLILLLMVVSSLGCYEQRCYKHSCICLLVNICIHFSQYVSKTGSDGS